MPLNGYSSIAEIQYYVMFICSLSISFNYDFHEDAEDLAKCKHPPFFLFQILY